MLKECHLDVHKYKTIHLKVSVIDGKPDPNISTFAPLDQQINSNIMYTGNGYMPCNGYVPCQVSRVTPLMMQR